MLAARVDALSVHEPVLVNLLGHSAGTLIFGIFLVLLWRSGAHGRAASLTRLAAAMAFTWNAGSLVLLAWAGAPRGVAEPLTVLTASALSLLPALLLDISLEGRSRSVAWAGYALSAASAVLHASEFWVADPLIHRKTLLLTAAGFAGLTVVGALAALRNRRGAVAAMALIVFSLSFAHFHEQGAHAAWPLELAMHHAGIPLSLFILSQDYRFVLLDAFLRFLTSVFLAGLFTFGAWKVGLAAGWLPGAEAWEPRVLALMLVAACALLAAYALASSAAQRLLTRAVFRRQPSDALLRSIRQSAVEDEPSFLDWGGGLIAQHFHADRFAVRAADTSGQPPAGEGASAVIRGNLVFELGRRVGGRRYLSEDLTELNRLAAALGERLERFHDNEMKRLVSQAELRALQSQIHPHFLFNALNTLYGIIPKESRGARQTVLNLADIFRYFLRTDRTLIPLEEEMRIVEAYLEIEALRLGPKLETRIDVGDDARGWMIPVLTVEPLVENAVKHGVAALEHGGRVEITARVEGGSLRVAVSDTGKGFPASPAGGGVGLENVNRRLRLHYGDEGRLDITNDGGGTRVEIVVPRAEQNGSDHARSDRG